MLPLLLAFVAIIVLFTLGVRWGVVIIGKVLGRVVHERHQNAEYITSTGQVPEAWTRPYFEQIDVLLKHAVAGVQFAILLAVRGAVGVTVADELGSEGQHLGLVGVDDGRLQAERELDPAVRERRVSRLEAKQGQAAVAQGDRRSAALLLARAGIRRRPFPPGSDGAARVDQGDVAGVHAQAAVAPSGQLGST